MRILVTGATGSLGIPLCLNLKSLGFSVVGQGRSKSRLQLLNTKGVETRELDLVGSDLRSLVKGFDAIVHSAALTRPWGPKSDFIPLNVLATENLMQAALGENIKRFVHISTTAVYYDGTPRSQITEDSPLPERQSIQYAATKRESELIAMKYAALGLPMIILRPRAILSEFDQTLMPRILPKLRKKFFPLLDGGNSLIDLTPAESISLAVVRALEVLPSFSGAIYNLTNDESIRVIDLLRWVSQSTALNPKLVSMPSGLARGFGKIVEAVYSQLPSKEPPITCYMLDLISNEQTFNIAKIKQDLSYRPAIGVKEAIFKLGRTWK